MGQTDAPPKRQGRKGVKTMAAFPELIRIENRGRETRVYIAEVETGMALRGFSLDHSKRNLLNPVITVSFGINDMLKLLSELTPEQIQEAKRILKANIDRVQKSIAAK